MNRDSGPFTKVGNIDACTAYSVIQHTGHPYLIVCGPPYDNRSPFINIIIIQNVAQTEKAVSYTPEGASGVSSRERKMKTKEREKDKSIKLRT